MLLYIWLRGIESTFLESNSKSVCLAKELCTVLIWEWMTELRTFQRCETQYLMNPDPKHNICLSLCYLVWIWKREPFHSCIKRPAELFQLLFKRAFENDLVWEKKSTCKVGPRETAESWMFISTERMAWVAQALLITCIKILSILDIQASSFTLDDAFNICQRPNQQETQDNFKPAWQRRCCPACCLVQ